MNVGVRVRAVKPDKFGNGQEGCCPKLWRKSDTPLRRKISGGRKQAISDESPVTPNWNSIALAESSCFHRLTCSGYNGCSGSLTLTQSLALSIQGTPVPFLRAHEHYKGFQGDFLLCSWESEVLRYLVVWDFLWRNTGKCPEPRIRDKYWISDSLLLNVGPYTRPFNSWNV